MVATDQKGIQGARIGIFHGGMLGHFAKLPQGGRADSQQPAHLAGSVDRSRLDGLGPEQSRQLFPGPRPQIEGRTGRAVRGQPGAALPEVWDLLGHASVEMTERYAHLAPERLRGAVARLDWA